jgi:mono/diheme cytochrome c family protein
MQMSAGAVILFIAMILLLGMLVAYASGVGKRSHEEGEGVPTGNPSMERKVVATLGMMILSGLLLTGYSFVEPRRQVEALERQERIAITRGVEQYTSLCIGCHGIDGKGAVVPGTDPPVVAPQLDRDDMRPKEAEAYKARYDYVVKTLHRGKGIIMPAWGKTDGGALSDEQIHELALFITKGDTMVTSSQTAWQHAREISREKIAHGAPEPELPKLDTVGLSADALAGQSLFTGKGGCVGCHVIGSLGGVTGPALTNIATVAETRKPGTAADAYIEESIRNSQAFVAPGYSAGVMPSFQGLLSDQEIKELVAFLMTRK